MRALAITTILILTVAPVWAGCRLSTRECSIIAQEMANELVMQQRDEMSLGSARPTIQQTLALIERHTARLQARSAKLPALIANEYARIELCDSIARAKAVNPSATIPKADCR